MFSLLPPEAQITGTAQMLPTWGLSPGGFPVLPGSLTGSRSQESGQSCHSTGSPAQLVPTSGLTQLCSPTQQHPIASNHSGHCQKSHGCSVWGCFPSLGSLCSRGCERSLCRLLATSGTERRELLPNCSLRPGVSQECHLLPAWAGAPPTMRRSGASPLIPLG